MEIYCFGDSHSRYFKRANTLAWAGVFGPTSPSITAFDYVAASAKGFSAGPQSRFAYKKFTKDFAAHNPHFVCLAYGQVDAEVGYYFRKYVSNSQDSVEDDLEKVFSAYVQVAKTLLFERKLVFKGLNPSALRIDTQIVNYSFRRLVVRITDPDERDRIWKAISENPPSVAEHARINVLANEILAHQVRNAGLHFFDVRQTVEDPQFPGLARWEHIPAESDVHLTDSFLLRQAYADGLFDAFGQRVRHNSC